MVKVSNINKKAPKIQKNTITNIFKHDVRKFMDEHKDVLKELAKR